MSDVRDVDSEHYANDEFTRHALTERQMAVRYREPTCFFDCVFLSHRHAS